MVPSGWERKPLVNVAEVRTGVAKGKKGIKNPIEVPYLRVANVQDGHIDLTEVKTITIERHQLERYCLKPGDVLMTEGGDFDKLGRGDVWQGQITPCLNQNHVFAVRVDSKVLEPYYLASLSGSHYGKTYFLSCAKRSTNLASINSTQLKEFPVLVPPLSEQRKIAKILSTWDKAISTTERIIDNSKQQKKALMQQLLTGKKRLLDDLGKPFKGEWEEFKLTQVAEVVMGSSPKSSSYNESNDGLPLVQGNADIKSRRSAPRVYTSEITKECRCDDILLSVRAPVGTVAKSIHEACIGRGISAIRAKKHHVQEYLYQWLLWFEPRWEKYSQGSTFEAVNSNDIKSLHLIVPTYTEQAKIASVLSNADQEIELFEQQLADLKQEKKALMQQLLTGKKRVKI